MLVKTDAVNTGIGGTGGTGVAPGSGITIFTILSDRRREAERN